MYDLKEIITGVDDIPEPWIYVFFYWYITKNDITQPFDGRTIKVRSIQNRDSNPSLSFYYDKVKKQYRWHDFSWGKGGDYLDFVCLHLNKDVFEGMAIIRSKYEQYQTGGGKWELIDAAPTMSKSYGVCTERYSEAAVQFWRDYHIGLATLFRFNTSYIPNYTLTVRTDRENKEYRYAGMFFGYYRRTSEGGQDLYQIYRPGKDPKYISVKSDYLMGSDQLRFKSDTCAIVSGMKDILAATEVDLNLEYVAPSHGEGSLIKAKDVEFLKSRYKHVVTMLDYDAAGIKAMMQYNKIYGLPYVIVKLSKDLAENNRAYSLSFLKSAYSLLINKKINHG